MTPDLSDLSPPYCLDMIQYVASAHTKDTDLSCNHEENCRHAAKTEHFEENVDITHKFRKECLCFDGAVILIFSCFVSVCFQLM